jgi:Amt family ammonium transporter
LKAQAIGSLTITLAVFVVAFVMMFIINKLGHPWKLRIEEHGETGAGGIDVFDHGIEVYPAQDDEISLSGLFDKGVKSI